MTGAIKKFNRYMLKDPFQMMSGGYLELSRSYAAGALSLLLDCRILRQGVRLLHFIRFSSHPPALLFQDSYALS